MLASVCQPRASTAFALTLLAPLVFATQAAALSFALTSEFDGVEPDPRT
jgi:hypothetical protein